LAGTAYCHGAATIINGITLGLGAAFGIALKTEAKVELTNDPAIFKVTIQGEETENTKMAEWCVKEALRKFGKESEHGAKITTTSDIPISRGLKSSSAAANAIVLAAYNAMGENFNDLEVINLGIDAALKAKVTLTGAFDDATATYFGNVVVTDNVNHKILVQYPIDEDYEVLIYVPAEKIRKFEVNTEKLHGIKDSIRLAHELALNGNYLEALQINGMAYGTAMGLDTSVAQKALDAGAVTAGISGTGPATVILVTPDTKGSILNVIGDRDKIICTKINRKKAGIGIIDVEL
jgi:shikimate kinase